MALDIKRRLEGMGYAVTGIAATEEDAKSKAATTSPDLILMDIRLQGGGSGIRAARHIRDHYAIPVIYLTANSDDETIEQAKTAEPFGYLLKPFKERELQTTVEMALYKHRMEMQLRASERRYATTLRSIGDGVIAADSDGRITFMNPAAEMLTGWIAEEAMQRPMSEVMRVTSQEAAEPGTELGRETLLAARDGRELPIEYMTAPIRGEDDSANGLVCVFRDISQRKKLEELLRQAEKMEAVGRLAGGIAHDFNNLLTAILGYTSMLQRNLREDRNVGTNLEEIARAGRRAADLTQQLLAFSRKQMLQPRELNLNDAVTRMEMRLRQLMDGDISIALHLSSDLGTVKADPDQIEQVIFNLALNARDAMPFGGDLTIETSNRTLTEEFVSYHDEVAPGRYAVLTIIDTGAGMDASTLDRIYEPFFTTRPQGQGTGLGLSTVYGIVKQSGGYICVESEPGMGTIFQIFLPRVDEEKKVASVADSNGAQAHAPETVLLVEDEEMVRTLVGSILKMKGYKVLEAQRGPDAIELCRRHDGDIHLVITDVMMPEMSGGELAAQVAQMRPSARVLFMSGYNEDSVLDHGAVKSGFAFMQKPFTPDRLVEKVHALLDR